MPSINANWDDTKDMLYGMGPEINNYLIRLYNLRDYFVGGVYNSRSRRWEGGTRVRTSDQAFKMKEERYAAINTYNVPLGSVSLDRYGVITTVAPTSLNVKTQAYLTALNNSPKYRPVRVSGSVFDPSLLTALQKGQNTLDARHSPDKALLGAARELAIRRSCKFGIEYSLQIGGKIHYILDGLDMKVVANKTLLDKTINLKSGATLQFKKISICTSELRFLFRNWGRIGPTGKVKFYLNFQEVVPPWENAGNVVSVPAWAEYAAHRVEKAIGKIRAKSKDLGGVYFQQHMLKECAAFMDARTKKLSALQQIVLFHKIPAVLVNDQ